MNKDEALKLALEALEEAWYHVGTFQPTEKAIDLYDEARTAIREALAQPETLPWTNKMSIDVPNQILYTAPQRKPLTDEEVRAVIRAGEYDSMEEFARAIEAAVWEKQK